jgi:hypothetical protein
MDFHSHKKGMPALNPRPYRRWAPDKLSTYRICNVIFWSYNPHDDPHVAARAHRAAKLLRALC